MTPGNAVRKKAHAAIHTDRTHDKHWCNLPDGQHSPACHWLVDVWLAGHAEGRAEGMKEAEQVFDEIYGHHIRTHYDGCEMNHRDCRFHRALARSRGAAEGK